MISPVWSFVTGIARPFMQRSSAFMLLAPTPKFWGNSDPDRTGTNNPHGIAYLGTHPERFVRAFETFGIPLEFRWDLIRGKRGR